MQADAGTQRDKGGERNGRNNVSNSSAGEVVLEVLICMTKGKVC